jgi:hypothetical protein
VEFLQFRSYNIITIRLRTVVIIVILVIIFSDIEFGKGAYFRYNGIIESLAFVKFHFILFSFFLLFRIMVKNHASVLRSYVISLPVQGCRIMALPKGLKQLIISDLRWIVHDLYHLCVPGVAFTHLFICRIFNSSTAVAGGNF